MTAAAREGLLQEMTEVLVAAAKPRRVILFGSWARGDERPDSDVDLLVEEDGPFGPGRSRRREMARLTRLLARFSVPQDLLVYSVDEVARWAGSRNHVIARALREGKVLYERH